jgi:hypothetical protein
VKVNLGVGFGEHVDEEALVTGPAALLICNANTILLLMI